MNPSRITTIIYNYFINYCDINYNCIKDEEIFNEFDNVEFSFLQLEPLNVPYRLECITKTFNNNKKYLNYKIYDYSKSNIAIMNESGITNCEHLPYNVTDDEKTKLINLYNNTEKIYDFGFINKINTMPITPPRRNKVLEYLIEKGFSVHLVSGWGGDRDKELAKCKIILNIHGQMNNNENPSLEECGCIFDHIRCDRLLESGFQILSEESLHLDDNFIKKYSNLKIIKYSEFCELDKYNSLDLLVANKIKGSYSDKKKIIDCFTFYNELDMLNYRLNILENVVDYFILVEANQTHAGKTKKLYFNENKHKFEKYKDKIIHVIVDLPLNYKEIDISKGEQWENERFQRNAIKYGFSKINISDKDLIIISDLDEIPDPNTLSYIKTFQHDIGFLNLEQDFYYYNLNCKKKEKWYYSKMISYKKFKELNYSCDEIRHGSDSFTFHKGGWHLSYFGSPDFIVNKLENFAHQEYNNENIKSMDNIKNSIENGLDLFNREPEKNLYEIIKIDIKDNDYLPPRYDEYLKNYYEKNTDVNSVINFLNTYESSAWLGHLHFASWIVSYLNPKIIVDLGVDWGHSTFAFASAKIGHIYGIDSFEGDVQAGFKNTYEMVIDVNNNFVKNNLILDNVSFIKGYFDDVFLKFEETIDILHIDGLHTYECVKNDYDKWSTKTHNNSVILFHDVESYPDTVGKLFNEIPYYKFYFSHSAGLGVACKNYDLINKIINLPEIPNKNLIIDINANNKDIVNNKDVKKYCFIHSCNLPGVGTSKLDNIIELINSSGLINKLDTVFINNIGMPIDNDYLNKFDNKNKYEILNYSGNILLFENPTINRVIEFSKYNPDSYILYLHTKGITHNNNEKINDWINMMLYYLVEKHEGCFRNLENNKDVVGCNFLQKLDNNIPKHFSGNFWWGNSNYLKNLTLLDETNPSKPECEFILFKNNPSFYEIHNSGVNHYHECYSRSKYAL